MTEPTRFPLAWPSHKPRTSWTRRKVGKFSANEKPITRVSAMARLERELAALGASYPLVSSNLELRRDGQPHMGKPEPRDPGVCVYFALKGKPFAMACDTFTRLEQNIAAIAAHINATRAIERYGVATAAETLQNFSSLPPPSTAPQTAPQRPWWIVFGVMREQADMDTVAALYRVKAKTAAANEHALLELNLAREAAIRDLAR